MLLQKVGNFGNWTGFCQEAMKCQGGKEGRKKQSCIKCSIKTTKGRIRVEDKNRNKEQG